MTVAEVDALLYLPGHPRQQLLRALRIPALSPGWQASFRALLDRQDAGSGNAGLAATSPPPAWPGFRPLTVTGIDRESDSVDLDPPRRPRRRAAAGRAAPASTSRCASSPSAEQRPLLRNYSLSGPPGAGDYRISVKREHDGAASGYLHTRLARRRPARHRRAARHLHPRPDARARAADQRRHRRHARCSPCCTRSRPSTPSGRSGGCTARAAAATTRSPPRPARSSRRCPNAHRPRLLQPPRPGRPRGPRLRQRRAGSSASVLAELEPPRDAEAYLCGPAAFMEEISAGLAAIGLDASPHPHRAFGARARPDARHRGDARAAAPPARRASPETARRSSSPAATSPSPGAATTPACSSSPRPATCPSAGRAAPASATTARRPSSPATSTTAPTRSSRPPTAARSSAARSRAATSSSICERVTAAVLVGRATPGTGAGTIGVTLGIVAVRGPGSSRSSAPDPAGGDWPGDPAARDPIRPQR